ncbi:polysaccharide biosynthesis C-terminal domain-containing protein [Vibrio tasmaniensis]|uniref:MATE family efflux transporter n=1 Tax=Vibrio tasmaniensis TaxID=212663 RepID=UPI0013013B53|nr:polysaccharide biosynthesis C-terminal domain-containing protein [Vibrio tasmaniensis]
MFIVRGFGSVGGFLMSLVVTNTTEVSHAGVFFFALALTQLGGGLLTLGSPNALLKVVGADYGTSWKRINQDVSVVLKYVFGLSIVLTLISVAFPHNLSSALGMSEIEPILPAIALAILVFALVQIFSAVLQGKQDTIVASTVQNVVAQFTFITLLGLIVWLDSTQTSASLFYIHLFALSLAMLLGGAMWFKTTGATLDVKAKLSSKFKASLSSLFIVMLMGSCVQWTGQFAIAKFLTSTDVALFSSAQRTAMLVSFVLIAVNLVVTPKFARAFARGRTDDINKLSLLSSRIMMLMVLPVISFMVIFPEFLMGLFGEEYKEAAPLLRALSIGQFISVISGSVGMLLVMTGNEKEFRNCSLIAGPVSIVLAILLTSNYGSIGAAFATSISLALYNLLAAYKVKKILGFNPYNIFRKIK